MSGVFKHGDLRLYLLNLLQDRERHGYELIRALEDRFLGLYSPSPGTIYPRLAALEEEGLIERREVGGRKVYRLTDRGSEELAARVSELRAIAERVAERARVVRDDVRSSARDLREAVREVRRAERQVVRGVAEAKGAIRSLQLDLELFASDVLAAARRHRLDRNRLHGLRVALLDARAAVIAALESPRGPSAPA